MSERRPLCRFCGQRHFGCCETDRAGAKSFITGYLADRPHRMAAVREADTQAVRSERFVREADGTITASCPCGCGVETRYKPSGMSDACRNRAKRRTNAD